MTLIGGVGAEDARRTSAGRARGSEARFARRAAGSGGDYEEKRMSALLIGYARVSTDQQDLTAQRDGLAALEVGEDRVYVDHGLTGANRDRPGLRQGLLRVEPATPLSSPSSTAWRDRSLTRATSSRT
jgi:hypothetical protein